MNTEKYRSFFETVGAENGWDFSQVKNNVHGRTWDFQEEVISRCRPADIMLDIGTGGGEVALAYASSVTLLVGIDYAHGMIGTARCNAAAAGRENVRFLPMDAAKLEFPACFFNLVSCRQAPFDAREVYRVLTDGGTFLTQQVSEADKINIKEKFGRGQNYGVADGTERDALIQSLRDAGFKTVEVFEYDAVDIYQTPEDLLFLLKHTPILIDFGRDPEDFETFKKLIEENRCEEGIKTNEKRYMLIARK
jgi:ubiquinone/menaquinone biosynthesis C-methylase UbiE